MYLYQSLTNEVKTAHLPPKILKNNPIIICMTQEIQYNYNRMVKIMLQNGSNFANKKN